MGLFSDGDGELEQYHNDYFKKDELDVLLPPIKNKTFEELDIRKLFETQKGLTIRQMNKGIFGNVIEQSVLGMKANPKPKPDITIDYTNSSEKERGVLKTEIKTTGVEENKNGVVPKERVSVTGVSIGKIETEIWEDSRYYHKLLHILWIFYLYEYKDKQKNERYSPYEQRRFKVLNFGYQHLEDDKKELAIFQNDWTIIHNYLVEHQSDIDNKTNWYPMLHQNTKQYLIYTDIAPRYPNSPRLAFKNSYVTTVYDMFVHRDKYEQLSFAFNSIEELNMRLHGIAERFADKTLENLSNILGVSLLSQDGKPIKNVTETIAIRLFDPDIKKLNSIEVFCKAGIHLKTMTLKSDGNSTEDNKLFKLNVAEFSNPDTTFDESEYYNYFREHKFLYILFEEAYKDQPDCCHKFLGFKWFDFDCVKEDYEETWTIIRDRIYNKTLVMEKDRIYKGKQTYAPNFPKGSKHNIFVRGSNSKNQRTGEYSKWTINGIKMHPQDIWAKGRYISEVFKHTPFI